MSKGLTLIELLVGTAVLGVVLAVWALFYPLGFQSWDGGTARLDAMQHARIGLEEIVNELLCATRVETDAAGRTVTYWKQKDGNPARYLIYLRDGQLYQRLPEGTVVPLASLIHDLEVRPVGLLPMNGRVTVRIVASCRGEEVMLRSGVVPRNLNWGGL